MVMVSPKLNPQACWEFEGDIMVLHHPTTIQTRYQVRRKSEYRTFKMWKHLDNLSGFQMLYIVGCRDKTQLGGLVPVL